MGLHHRRPAPEDFSKLGDAWSHQDLLVLPSFFFSQVAFLIQNRQHHWHLSFDPDHLDILYVSDAPLGGC